MEKTIPKVLICPARYMQGRDITNEIGSYFKILGKKTYFIGSPTGVRLTRKRIEKSYKEEGLECEFEEFKKECCKEEIARVKALVLKSKADVICGLGGGKAIDTAKYIANDLKLRCAVFPTICSTDAPCSALSVLYTKDGEFLEYAFFPRNPDLVFIDTQIVANAPKRFLVAGIGDALATWFEAEQATITRKKSCAGGIQTVTSLALAKLCYETLLENGRTAVISCGMKVASPAFEKICEANTLLSGLGFESCGLAAAHAIHNGLTALEDTHRSYHGQKVNIGTLTQLIMQGADSALVKKIYKFCYDVGLPITLEEIGIKEWDKEKLMKVCVKACGKGETIHNMPFPVCPQDVYDSMVTADALGKKFKKEFEK